MQIPKAIFWPPYLPWRRARRTLPEPERHVKVTMPNGQTTNAPPGAETGMAQE
jgi:hypothetical protein